MPKYITTGFDREADAARFLSLVKGNGNLIQLYQKPRGGEGAKVHNIQARGIHEWTPRPGEVRRFENTNVTVEFKDDETARDFMAFVIAWSRGDFHETPIDDTRDQITAMLDYNKIAKVTMEKADG